MTEPAYDQPGPLLAVPMPSRVRALPRNHVGYPIPYFVAETPDGGRDFRIADPRKWWACVRERLCWVCGQRRKGHSSAFLLGPMCVVNRRTAEPPCHVECAEYSAKACPFLARPNMVRRDRGLPEGLAFAGVPILRNPGVAVVYVATEWQLFQPPGGKEWERMFALNPPIATSWWTHGRAATREEALAAIDSGMPTLRELADDDDYPPQSHRVLDFQYRRALKYLPDTAHEDGA